MPKQKIINLYKHKKEKNPIRTLRKRVLECLGESVFEITSIQDFAYQSLKCFYPINKSLSNDIASIEKGCNKIFKTFPIVKGRLYELSADGSEKEIISKQPEFTPVQKFLQTYLQFETSPGITLLQLQDLVKQDMMEINELIKWYETQDFIKVHIEKNNKPRNHEDRILFDFYYRCIKEQKIITDYYLVGIKKRAVAKANYWGSGIKQIISFSERFRDRPYHFAGYLSYAYFDCRRIDLIANKVSEFAYDESGKLEKLYATNKETFYRKLFKRHRPAAIIQEFNYYLPHLPLKSDRRPIFDELETLFKRKSWIGFYSLALTQIEGLFSEMYIVLNPEAESNWKALPEKVQYARRFHDMSTYYFDYYQYQIPRLRNKFMHYGYDEDFKIKSFDLLFDLRHLLKMFMELNNPLVKIKQLHVKRKFENFVTYTDFAEYFQLLNNLTPKQRKEIDSDIKSFEKDFLVTYCNAEYVCLEVAQGLPQEIDEFLNECNRRILDKGKLFDFADRNFKKLAGLLETDKELSEIIRDCYLFNRRESDALLSYHLFLSNYKKYLSTLNNGYLKPLHELVTKYSTPLSNIFKIKEELPAEE